ncbi:MAG: YiiX/YebB-like N1pC/P60 family cysteine hydrolase [Archangium sp.]
MTNLFALLTVLAASPGSQHPSVYSLEQESFVETAKHDLETLKQLVAGMSGVMARVKANDALFRKHLDVYSPEQKETLLSTWGSLFSYFSAAEGLRQKYWDFVKLSPTDPRHAWGFLVTHTALTSMLAYGLQFASLTLNDKQLEVLFDEANEEYGVPSGSFAQFKWKAIHVATSTQLFTGDTWASATVPLMKRQETWDDAKWAFDEMKADSKIAQRELIRHGGKLYAGNGKDIAIDESMRTLFPAQRVFAEWMGDTRFARIGQPLVTTDDIARVVIPKLLPGDVIVTRQNWFLSNIGLPGFWPHAELYVGTASDLSRSFDADTELNAWVARQPEKAKTFSQLLQKRYPKKWKTYAEGTDFQGHAPIRVIESISEGVSFTAVEHAFGVDYLGALRPRLSPLEKARAIERAFKYQGRPYDFDFDFFSDSTLVCTELVYKAYQPGGGMKGVSLELVNVAGRRTLPANEIVKRFDKEAGKSEAQFDFVLFLDGSEATSKVVTSDEETFRKTWKRLKWDVAQK